MKDISMVITVYNGEKYIEETLNSICNQSFENIEIIVVDDASQDASRDIVKRMQKKDDKITLIEHETNKGTHASRKDGVAATVGKYIMFSDQDDQYLDGALDIAFGEIEKQQVDVLQYGVKVVNCGTWDENAIKEKEKYYKPYTEKRIERDLVRSRWEDSKFSINIWNKIYNGDICRKAFAESESIFLCYHEDYYESFLILYESNSYMGIKEKLYVHYFGRGTTGHQEMTLARFELIASGAKVSSLAEQFLFERNDSKYEDVIEIIARQTILDCMKHIAEFVADVNQKKALYILLNYVDGGVILSTLFNENYVLRKKLSRKNKELQSLKKSKSYKLGKMLTKPMRLLKK